MSQNSRAAIANTQVALQSSPEGYRAWLQHIALALNTLMAWANQPRLVPQTVATLPESEFVTPFSSGGERANRALPGMLAMVTDGASAGGIVSGGGTRIQLVFFNGTDWKVVAE